MRWANVNSSMLCSASLRNTGLKRIADQVRLLLFATDPLQPRERHAVAKFRRSLLQERGLSPSTLLNYVPVAEQFLAERFHNRAPNFAVLRAPRPKTPLSLFTFSKTEGG